MTTAPAAAEVFSTRTVVIGSQPAYVAITSDGSQAWTTDYNSNAVVGFTTGATNALVSSWPLGTFAPSGIAMFPDGTRAAVANYGSDNVSIVTLATGAVFNPPSLDVTFSGPSTVAVSPDGQYLAVGVLDGGQVVLVRTSDWQVQVAYSILGSIADVAFTPDGSTIVATDSAHGEVVLLGVQSQWISTVTTGSDPAGLALSQDGTRLYVALETTQAVDVFSMPGATFVARIMTGSMTNQVAVSPDGSQVWASQIINGKVVVIDTASLAILESRTVIGSPYDIAFTPNGCQVWITQRAAGTDTVMDLDPCLSPPAALPDTGASPALIIALFGVGVGLLTAGIVLVILVRRRKALEE